MSEYMHCDLTPDNIMLTANGTVKVVGFEYVQSIIGSNDVFRSKINEWK